MHTFRRIGLLDTEHPLTLGDWSSLAPRALAAKFAIRLKDDDSASFLSALADIVDIPRHKLPELVYALAWLGIAPDAARTAPAIAVPSRPMAAIDLLTLVLGHQLRYRSGERDMVVLLHEITVSPAPGAEEETHTATLIAHGTRTASAMSRTVGLPVALATLAVLDGHVRARGVHGPTMADVYEPVLRGLEERGLGMRERVRRGAGSGDELRDGLRATMDRRSVA